MAKPIEQKEPVHPEAKEEYMKRISLLEAMIDEAELLDEVAKLLASEKTSPIMEAVTSVLSASLKRIIARWQGEYTFTLNKKERSIDKIRTNREQK